MTTIGVGIIGASPSGSSWAALTHVPALRALPDYELLAVSTSRPESARAAAEAWGVAGYDNPTDLINHPGVDLVVVAVKVAHHHALVSQALAAGKMVYSEWPLGADLAEATQLADQAAAAGVRTIIGLQGRYAPAATKARDLVDSGYLGDVLATTIVGSGLSWGPVTDRAHAYLYDADNGATTLTASVMHALDTLLSVLGEARSVSATLAVRRSDVRLAEDATAVPVTNPDQVAVTATLTSGAVLSLFYRGGVSRGDNFRWEINGSSGDLVITSDTPGHGNLQALDLILAGGRGDETDLSAIPVPRHGTLVGPASNVGLLYEAFAADLRTGGHTVPDFAEAVRRHRLVEAIKTASRTGHSQDIS